MFNTHSTNPLIPREQHYVLDRKLVTIHSEDRDINKWPQSNHFEVELPHTLEKVQSMRLVQCSFPINYYTFSNDYQNTKLSFLIQPSDPSDNYYSILNDAYDNSINFTATIQEGFYCPEELAFELQDKLNEAVNSYIKGINPSLSDYENIKVLYDKVGQKYWFANIKDKIIFLFEKQEIYDIKNCYQPIVWENYTNWGLPSYLGFDRKIYESIPALDSNDLPVSIKFSYLGISPDNIWISPTSPTLPLYYITAPFTPNLVGDKVIYMEVKKYNSYDEIKPYSQATNNLYGNDYNGTVNSAFAKIPITNNPLGELVDSTNFFLQNITHYDPPIEKISKLEFKFRYHDGRLVDFKKNNFNFTIEFNQLKNEISKVYTIRIPQTYHL
jgi:plasmid maintenance system killer protein